MSEHYKISKKGIDLIKKYEGFEPCPYLDAAGIPTIGYGNTYYPNGIKVSMKDPEISKELAEEMLGLIVDKFEWGVSQMVSGDLKQSQFDALVSFAYNLGLGALQNSTLLKKIKEDPYHPDIPNEFTKWIKAGGKKLRGLAKRRLEEANVYYFGYDTN